MNLVLKYHFFNILTIPFTYSTSYHQNKIKLYYSTSPPLFVSSICDALSKMTGTTKSSVTIVAVKLVEFPSKQPNGFSWDPLCGKPDIYFTIGKGGMKRRMIENATDPV